MRPLPPLAAPPSAPNRAAPSLANRGRILRPAGCSSGRREQTSVRAYKLAGLGDETDGAGQRLAARSCNNRASTPRSAAAARHSIEEVSASRIIKINPAVAETNGKPHCPAPLIGSIPRLSAPPPRRTPTLACELRSTRPEDARKNSPSRPCVGAALDASRRAGATRLVQSHRIVSIFRTAGQGATTGRRPIRAPQGDAWLDGSRMETDAHVRLLMVGESGMGRVSRSASQRSTSSADAMHCGVHRMSRV